METLLRCIYAGQKYPHIYMLSISTCMNQSTNIRGVLYIPIEEYNYKIITGYNIILQGYNIINRRKVRITRRYTSMNSTKDAHKLQKETQVPNKGPERKDLERFTADPLCYHCATLINRKSITVQAPRSRHAGPGESESFPTSD